MPHELLPLILLAGIPGSGKTTVASRFARSVVISADDFYLSVNDPRLPYHRGKPDWESVDALNLEELQDCLCRLVRGDTVSIPCYDMQTSKRHGQREIDPRGDCAIVAEGVHVFELRFPPEINVCHVLLSASSLSMVGRRLIRDVKEKRFSRRAALLRIIPLLRHYRTYDYHQRKRADYLVEYKESPGKVAAEIQRLYQSEMEE